MKQLATGMRDVGRGLDVLNAHPRLWKWLIAPAAVTCMVLAGLIFGVVHVIDPVRGWLIAHLPSVLNAVAGKLVTAAVVVALSLVALLVFAPLAGVIAGPFNEQLSEHIESVLTGEPGVPFGLRRFLHGLSLGIVHGVRRLLIMIVGALVVFAVALVPVVGTAAALILAALFAARGSAYDSYDAVLARRMMSYRAKLAFLARHRGRTLGLGATVAALLLVPGINLVALGLGAAGATVACHAIEHGVPVRQLRSAGRTSAAPR